MRVFGRTFVKWADSTPAGAGAESVVDPVDPDLKEGVEPVEEIVADSVEAAEAELAAFFNFEKPDDEADTDEDAEPVAPVEEPAAEPEAIEPVETDEEPAAEPVEEPAAEPPVVQRDEYGRVLDPDGIPLNDVGMPDISDEEWQEFLEDEELPLGERNKTYLDYQAEFHRRTAIRESQLVQLRERERTETRELITRHFGEVAAPEILPEVESLADTFLSGLAPEVANRPGFLALARQLALAHLLPGILEKHLPTVLASKGAVAPVETPTKETPAKPAKEPAKAPTGTRAAGKVKLVSVEAAGGQPGGQPRAAAPSAAVASLTAEEIAFAKSLDMTPEEYAEYKV